MDPAWQLGVNLLSSEEAGDFCAKQLGISREMQQSSLALLNAIVQGVNAMPFHNLQLLATEPQKRKPPTAKEVKIAMLKGEGGLCFVKQAFAGHLLEALGYKVEVLAASVTHLGNHIVILVHDVVERGDCFLVEAGSGYPSSTAVPITHGGFEHHFTESFLEFRYIKTEGEDLIRREHRAGDPSTRPVVPDSLGRPGEIQGWRRYFDFFWPQKGSLEQLSQGMIDVCTLPDASPFLTSLRAVRWVDGKMIAVKDRSFLEEVEAGKIKVTALNDAQDIKEKLRKYFPEVEGSTVDAAIEHWVHHLQKCDE